MIDNLSLMTKLKAIINKLELELSSKFMNNLFPKT